jgi:thioesterase domain-containing protein/acyl carrier protein
MILFLKRKLPEYMVPGLWMELSELPLNPNGKIDRNALPDVNEFQLVNDRVAPRNEAEESLAGIWKSVLAVNDLGMLDNFFDLGGQSLLAVQMLAEVEKKFRKKVSINNVFKYPTIELLAEFLYSGKAKDRYKSLVPIKATGNKTPLYIIHGDGYNMSNFVSLANYLDEQQPLFSLQPVGLDGKDEPFDSLEDMAAHYVSEILQHNPDGPYAIVGYSFGGYVAIEIKRQLENMGKEVKTLGIFDTDAGVLQYKKSGLKKVPKKLIRQIPKALFVVKSLINSPSETFNYQKEMAAKRFKSLSSKFGKHEEELTDIDLNLYKININHEVALNNYDLKPFHGTLHLFKAQSRMYFVDEFEFLGWKKFAKDDVIVYDIPGDHRTMFLPPHVKELAAMLQHILNNQ